MGGSASPKWVLPIAAALAGVLLAVFALVGEEERGNVDPPARVTDPTPELEPVEHRSELSPIAVRPGSRHEEPPRAPAPEHALPVTFPRLEETPAPPRPDHEALERRRAPARITVISEPPGAAVEWNGEPVGATPLIFRRPRDGEVHRLTVRSPAGEVQVREVRANDDLIEHFELAR